MSKAKHSNENALITSAALHLVAAQGWGVVTLDKVAKAAKMPVATVKARFASVYDLVPVIAAEIDREALAACGASGSVHDRLFDLVMARFDVLQKNRRAIESMADCAQQDRRLSCALGRTMLDGVYRIIEAAQIKDKKPPRVVIAWGLAGVYGWAFCVWRRDTSRDMAKTMAAVDRGLRWADKAVDLIKPHS